MCPADDQRTDGVVGQRRAQLVDEGRTRDVPCQWNLRLSVRSGRQYVLPHDVQARAVDATTARTIGDDDQIAGSSIDHQRFDLLARNNADREQQGEAHRAIVSGFTHDE